MTEIKEGFVFIIDTDTYAGNFERQLCAYVTGHVGDCGVGREVVDKDLEYPELDILQVAGETSTYRPCSIYPNLKGIYGSVGIFFESLPTQDNINFLVKRSREYMNLYRKENKLLGFRLHEVKQVINNLEFTHE